MGNLAHDNPWEKLPTHMPVCKCHGQTRHLSHEYFVGIFVANLPTTVCE